MFKAAVIGGLLLLTALHEHYKHNNDNKKCEVIDYIARNSDILYRMIMEDTKKNDIPMRRLALTRCFNTVFVILSLLLGYSETEEIIRYCWDEYQDFNKNANNVKELLAEIIKNENSNVREIYFVSINSFGMFHNEKKYKFSNFPGHVFLIEQNGNRYYMYQSYINSYTLKDYMDNNGFEITLDEIKKMMNDLITFYLNGEVWNDTHSKIWKDLTTINVGSKYNGFNINGMKFCHLSRRLNKNICYENLRYLIRKYKKLVVLKEDQNKFLIKNIYKNLSDTTKNENERSIVTQIYGNLQKGNYDNPRKEQFNVTNEKLKQKIKNFYTKIEDFKDETLYYSNVFKIRTVYDTDGIKLTELKKRLDTMENELKTKYR